MSSLNNLNLGFDYFLCMTHNVVVEITDKESHIDEFCVDELGNKITKSCSFLGQFFNIKKPAKKLSNDISVTLVRKIKEKENEKRWEKSYNKKVKQRVRDQELYSKQIPLGDSILNLDVVKL